MKPLCLGRLRYSPCSRPRSGPTTSRGPGRWTARTRRSPTTSRTPSASAGKNDHWALLWDGKTTAGWRGAKLDRFPATGWEIKDGGTVGARGGGARVGGRRRHRHRRHLQELRTDRRVQHHHGRQQRDQVLRRHRAQQGRGLIDRLRVPDSRRRRAPGREAGGERKPEAGGPLRPHPASERAIQRRRRVEPRADHRPRLARRALDERVQDGGVRARARRCGARWWITASTRCGRRSARRRRGTSCCRTTATGSRSARSRSGTWTDATGRAPYWTPISFSRNPALPTLSVIHST